MKNDEIRKLTKELIKEIFNIKDFRLSESECFNGDIDDIDVIDCEDFNKVKKIAEELKETIKFQELYYE